MDEAFASCRDRSPRGRRRPAAAWRRIPGSIAAALAAIGCSSPESSGQPGSGTTLSAEQLHREFAANPIDAMARYRGNNVAVSGLVGRILPLDRGEAAVHLVDGGTRVAIATFPRQADLAGVATGARIQLQCAFDNYEYQTVWLSFCTLTPSGGPAAAPGPSRVPSANLLYREYVASSSAAGGRYDGTVLELEGRRGDVIEMGSGGVAVHIADSGKSNAVIAAFADSSEVSGIGPGELFRLRCRVDRFEYHSLWLDSCRIAR